MNPNDVPSQALFGLRRASLAKVGMKQQEINAAIGLTPNNRTNKEIGDELSSWIRNRS